MKVAAHSHFSLWKFLQTLTGEAGIPFFSRFPALLGGGGLLDSEDE